MDKRLKTILLIMVLLSFAAQSLGQEPASVGSGSEQPKAEKPENKLVEAGKLYFSNKEYDLAIRQWEKALTMDPQNTILRGYIDEARMRLRETLQAPKDIAEPAAITTGPVSVLSMADCINIAVKNNIPLQAAAKSIKLGEMRIFESRRNMLPTIGLRYEQYSGRVNAREYVGRKQYFEGQQPIFHGGELFYTMKQSEVNLDVSKNDYCRIRNELMLQVKKAYYSLLKSHENLRLQRALSSEVEKIYGMVEKEYNDSLIPKVEWLNVSSQESQIKYQLISAEGDDNIAELILKQTMNMDYNDRIDVRPVGEFKKAEVDFDRTLRAAYMNRPEMKINALMLQYYKYEKKVQKAKGWIRIDMLGNWGLAKEEYDSEDCIQPSAANGWVGDPDQKLEQQYYAGLKFSMPIWGSTTEYSWTKEQFVPVVSAYQGTEAVTNSVKFNFLDNLKYYSDVQNSLIDFDRARQEMNKIIQDITLEVREDCFNYQKAVTQLITAAAKTIYQEKDLEINKLRRELDEIPDSAVVESMIKVAQEKFGYVSALTDCYTSIAALNKAVGVENYFESSWDNTGPASK